MACKAESFFDLALGIAHQIPLLQPQQASKFYFTFKTSLKL